MLNHLIVFKSALVAHKPQSTDAFRAVPRDFVKIEAGPKSKS